jgi:hypothetical protein
MVNFSIAPRNLFSPRRLRRAFFHGIPDYNLINMKRDLKDQSAIDHLRRLIDESLNDPRPALPAREVFRRLRRYHARMLKAERKVK